MVADPPQKRMELFGYEIVDLQYPIRTLKPPDIADFDDFRQYLCATSRFGVSEA